MRTYVVLGMHRNATSFVAKALSDQGVSIGKDLLGPSKWNPQGHFEDARFVALNDKILVAAGGNWADVPTADAIASAGKILQEEIRTLVLEAQSEMWGWKDPRTALTADLYLPHLSSDVYLIACFRKPSEVAASLQRRNGFSLEKGMKLTRTYNQRLIKTLHDFCGI